ncbi:MAG: PilZ domain-containing protein [Novosphingobium sp.]
MGEIGFDHRMREIGKRATSRLRVRLPAQIVTTGGTLTARLCDLSYFGARLSCESDLAPGREVIVRWGPYEAFGIIVWANGRGMGVRFFETLEPAVLIDTRNRDDVEIERTDNDSNRVAARNFVQGLFRR